MTFGVGFQAGTIPRECIMSSIMIERLTRINIVSKYAQFVNKQIVYYEVT